MGGLELRASGHSLKDSEVKILKDYQESNKKDLYDIGDELETIFPKYDHTNTNMWSIHKGTNNESLTFSIDGSISFTLKDVKKQPKIKDTVLESLPKKGLVENILLWIHESRGNICTYQIESSVEPKVSDFTVVEGVITTPDGDWNFIDKVMFKGVELKPTITTEEKTETRLTIELWTL